MKKSQQIFTVILLSFFTITNIHAQSLEDAMGGFEDNVNDVLSFTTWGLFWGEKIKKISHDQAIEKSDVDRYFAYYNVRYHCYNSIQYCVGY
jgi:hypothetical protein